MKTLRRLLVWSVVLPLGVALVGGSWATADTFTLDTASPSLGLIGAAMDDMLYDGPGTVPGAPPPPVFGPGGAFLGLMIGDIIDGLSDGADPVDVPHVDYFSVDRGSVGAAGSGVFAESTGGETAPGATPGQAGDIFVAGPGVQAGTNILAPAGYGWTLGTTTGDEANSNLITPTTAVAPVQGDNVYAYDLANIPTPSPASPVYFSLAPGSPTLALIAAGPADILVCTAMLPVLPVIFIPGGAGGLGLPGGADVDALALLVPPVGNPIVEFSLSKATAALAGVSGADILRSDVSGPAVIVHGFAALGLLVGDDVDALDVGSSAIPEPATLPLLAIGLVTLVARRWRRR